MTMETILRPVNGSSHDISVSGTTARTTVNFTNTAIGFYCATAAYIKFGGSDVEVSTSSYDMFIPAGVRVDLKTGGAGYVAVILASGTDMAYINEWTEKQL
jgi:hypothetical protein